MIYPAMMIGSDIGHDVVIDMTTSGTVGLSIGDADPSSSGHGGARQAYARCAGVGSCNVQYFDQVLVNGQWKQIPKTRWKVCPDCGGRGYK